MRIEKKNLIEFKDEQDPYNKQNVLNGYIHRGDYSKLIITNINGEFCNQEIATTPKMNYPNDFEGNFHFPPDIDLITSWEKLDGTNILQFVYKDQNFKSFVSYKTRLTMFPREDFQVLLYKTLSKHPDISTLPFENCCNLSYELYGYLNPITIVYDKDIEICLLFGLKENGLIISPSCLKHGSVSIPVLFKTYDNNLNLIDNYKSEQNNLETKLERIGDQNMFKGSEGAVWYCHLEHYTQLYKLKPPTIESYHHSLCGSMRMAKIAIRNTLLNATEDLYVLDYESILPYLEEEYSESEILLYKQYIELQIILINQEKAFEREIVKVYKENNLDINVDKRTTMHFFSNKYGNYKKTITKIYNILKKYFIT